MGRPKKNVEKRLYRAVGERLLDILTRGRPKYRADGDPLIGRDGQQVRELATAADISAAIKFLQLTGVQSTLQSEDQNQLMEQVRKRVNKGDPIKFPSEQAEQV